MRRWKHPLSLSLRLTALFAGLDVLQRNTPKRVGRSHGPGRGRLADTPPISWAHRGTFTWPPSAPPCNVAFLIRCTAGGELRGFDDLRGSITNTAGAILTPITLFGRDRITEATHLVRYFPRAGGFGKVDHKDSYKFLPIYAHDSDTAAVALWNPHEDSWLGFRASTQVSESIASVLRYNCVSRLLTTWILRLSMLGYFDDCGFITTVSTIDIN